MLEKAKYFYVTELYKGGIGDPLQEECPAAHLD